SLCRLTPGIDADPAADDGPLHDARPGDIARFAGRRQRVFSHHPDCGRAHDHAIRTQPCLSRLWLRARGLLCYLFCTYAPVAVLRTASAEDGHQRHCGAAWFQGECVRASAGKVVAKVSNAIERNTTDRGTQLGEGVWPNPSARRRELLG